MQHLHSGIKPGGKLQRSKVPGLSLLRARVQMNSIKTCSLEEADTKHGGSVQGGMDPGLNLRLRIKWEMPEVLHGRSLLLRIRRGGNGTAELL